MSDPTYPAAPQDQVSTIHLSYLLNLLLRRLWLISLCVLTVVLLAVGYVATARPIYMATAVVQVQQQEQRAFSTGPTGEPLQDLRSDEILKTIEQNLQAHNLFENVVRDPEINKDPAFMQGLVNGGEKTIAFSDLANRLANVTQIAVRRGTRLIDVSVYHPVPEMAQKIAAKIVEEYILENGATQTGASKADMQFLMDQSALIKDNLQKSENALQIYREALTLKDRVNDQQRVIDALIQRYREKHPELIQARALLAEIRQNFDLELKKVLANSPTEASYWASNTDDLDNTSPDARITSELRLVEARTNVLQREVDTESALFDNILKQMREANVTKESAPTQVRLEEAPTLPLKPAKPRKTLILALSGVGGIILGIGLVLILDALDSSLKTAAEAEEMLKLPVLGSIPRLSPGRSKKSKDTVDLASLVLLSDAKGSAAESLRSLRATLSLLGKAEDHRTTLFTSAFADEGKTFISCNYAVSLAQQGLKTLLIDTDLRRPAIHLRFNIENTTGLVDAITSGLDLREATHTNVIENLDILTSGSRCPNPAELLSGSGFPEILREAMLNYDRVVVDCSPVTLVSDSLLIAPYLQTICLVMRTADTPRRAIQHAIHLLERANARPVGVILNFVPIWSGNLSYAPYGYRSKDASKYRDVYS